MSKTERIVSIISIVLVVVILYSVYIHWHHLTHIEKSPFHPDKLYTQGKIDTLFAEILSFSEKKNYLRVDFKEVKIGQEYYNLAKYTRYQLDSYFQDKKNYQSFAIYYYCPPGFSTSGYVVCVFIEKDINEEITKYKEIFTSEGYFIKLRLNKARDFFWKIINGEKIEKPKDKDSDFKINPEYLK